MRYILDASYVVMTGLSEYKHRGKIRLFTLLIFCLLFVKHNNAQINVQWESRYNHPVGNGLDQARSMVIDDNGNVYVTGDSNDGSSFNIITVKYDNAGGELWTAEYDGDANGLDQTSAVDIDSNGDVFVVGYTYTGVGSDYDIVTLKYSGVDGSELWRQIESGSNNFDIGRDIKIDGDDNVIITGQVEPNSGGSEIVTIKYSNAGTLIWKVTYPNGSTPQSSLVKGTDDKLYGMTSLGGLNNYGVLFQYDSDADAYSKRLNFNGANNGREPYGNLVQASDGKFYGMTRIGGGSNFGVLFEYDPVTLQYAKKLDFTGVAEGRDPRGSLVEASNGNLYGMTRIGGANALGVLFEYNPATEVYTKRLDFSGAADGAEPMGSLVEASNGMLYGMTRYGGANGVGVLFEYDPSTDVYTKKFDFVSASGAEPMGSLVEASNGMLYGMTRIGGSSNRGVLFEYDPVSETYTNKLNFTGANGREPYGSLIEASNGNLYGMTRRGGTNDFGILFEYDPVSETFAKEFDFTGLNGRDPRGDLVEASNGKLYGMTRIGGENDIGVLFEYDPSTDVYTKKFDFNGANSFNAGLKVLIDENNDVYTVGFSKSPSNETDYILIKSASADGSQIWLDVYDNSGSPDEPRNAYYDKYTNNILVTGNTLTSVVNKIDFWTLSINANDGSLNWDRLYNGTATDDDIGNAVMTDTVGNTYVTGRSKGVGTNFDYVTIRYDISGNPDWVRRFAVPGNGLDNPSDIVVNDQAEIYVTGYSYNSVTNNDYLTVRYDSSGNVVWSTRFDGPASDVDNALNMGIDPFGNIYVTGNSKGSGTNWDYSTIKYCQHETVVVEDTTSICLGESVQLEASAFNGLNFVWTVHSGEPISVGDNFSCNPCTDPIASPSVTTTYVVTSENANGCENSDTVTVVVNPLPNPSIFADGPLAFCENDSVRLYTGTASSYLWTYGVDVLGTDSTVTVNQTGTYTVTVENEYGCENSIDETINTFDLPNISAGADQTICEGESVQVMASGGVSYLWFANPAISDVNIPDPVLSPITTETFSVIGTDVNGCSDTADVEVVVNPLPEKPVINRVGCDTLASSLVFGNQWIMNAFALPGETEAFLKLTIDGDYWIEKTDANGCFVVSDTMYIREIDTCLIIDVTATNDLNSDNFLNIYPNPSSGLIHVEYKSQDKAVRMEIINANGVIIEEKNLDYDEHKTTVNLDNQSAGIYLVRIITEGSILTRRIVLQ